MNQQLNDSCCMHKLNEPAAVASCHSSNYEMHSGSAISSNKKSAAALGLCVALCCVGTATAPTYNVAELLMQRQG